jgi:cellulose synthase/poly-beta-1,6-N-acetylglucosamine synthase-like glycosyltransferase
MIAWIAIACLGIVLAYAWVGYPLLLRLMTPTQGQRRVASPPVEARDWPRVTVVFSAHNEENHVAARLRNLLDLDYPREKLDVAVGADGCTDSTVAVVESFSTAHPRVRMHAFETRRGKAAVLKDLVRLSSPGAGVVVFTDANTVFRPDALRKMMRHFDDENIGGVCGRLILSSLPAHHGVPAKPVPEGSYWLWETALKQRESRFDSCLGANGAVYAVRKSLFWADLPDNTVVDDFVIGMKVREQGKRMVYDQEAVAVEELPETRHEWPRRVRIGSGDYQALWLCRRCLLPAFGRFAWMFWSHKVLRWFTPHMLVSSSVLSCVLSMRSVVPPYAGMRSAFPHIPLLLHLLLLAGAALGAPVGRSAPAWLGFLRLCRHFVVMQAALMSGFARFCCGRLPGYWTRTPRRGQVNHGRPS